MGMGFALLVPMVPFRKVDSWKMRHFFAQRAERRMLWGIGLVSTAIVVLSAILGRPQAIGNADSRLPAVSKYDTGYFDDEASLRDTDADTAHRSIPAPVLERLPAHKQAFCRRNIQDIIDRIVAEDAPAFSNPAGYLKFGTCWWASRFHRSAAYLINFQPEKKKPSNDEAKESIRHIVAMDKVVEIGGYKNLYEFSSDFRDLAVKAVENWQIRAGAGIEPIVRGMSGPSHPNAKELNSRMYSLYARLLARRDPVFQVLQIPGPGTHSWLVFDARAVREGLNPWKVTGYDFTIIDPNDPGEPRHIRYRSGADSIVRVWDGKYYGESRQNFVPLTAYDDDLGNLREAIQSYCKP